MEFDERFKQFYNEMVEKNSSYLEQVREEVKKETNLIFGCIFILIGAIIVILLYCGLYKECLSIILASIFVCFFIKTEIRKKNRYTKKIINNYKREFKKRVITPLVKLFSNDVEYIDYSYNKHRGKKYNKDNYNIHKSYIEADFANFHEYDEFYVEDLIIGKLNNNYNFLMCETATEYIDGNGLFIKIELSKAIDNLIYIRNDSKDVIWSKTLGNAPGVDKLTRIIYEENAKKGMDIDSMYCYDNIRIELDSLEFEKYFDVYTDDKFKTVSILSPEVMQMLVNFRIAMGIKFEITIKKNNIYIRCMSGDMFEPPLSIKDSLDKENLYKNYRLLEFVFRLSKRLIKTIEGI